MEAHGPNAHRPRPIPRACAMTILLLPLAPNAIVFTKLGSSRRHAQGLHELLQFHALLDGLIGFDFRD
ncbi:hypothetical protein VNO77_43962 [Canavalia gladiata]|uniref:Uncharacterized protein n=1 Tax=Canavalia gladiata TaxID=3824 RepID=A0AAN9JXP8_CANGL